MKVGILGSGFMGRTHARAYAKMKGVEVAAISSRHLEKAQTLANEIGGRATTDNLAIIEDFSTTPSALRCRRISTPSTRSPRSRQGNMCSWRSLLRSPPLIATV